MEEMLIRLNTIRSEVSEKMVSLALLIGIFIIAMDTTILNTVGPVIIDELGGVNLYGLISAAYAVLSCVTIPIFGKLSDRLGRKKIFMFCIALFVIASVLCGLATSAPMLIFYRALQGIGAGGITPTAIVIVSDMFSIEGRGKYQGHFSAIWGMSAALGPLLGAIIVGLLGWRWIFFINLPLGAIVLVAMLFYQEKVEKTATPINYYSAAFFTTTVFAILTLITEPSWSVILIPIALTSFVLFLRIEKNTDTPFLPIRILKNPSLLFFNLNTFLFFFALFGLEAFIPHFLQKVQGSSVLLSGIVLAGISFGWTLSSYPSGKIVTKYGYKKPILAGNVIITLSCVPFFFYTEETSMWLTFGILLTHGFCYGLIQTTATLGAYELASDEEKVFASSLQSFSRNIGTSFSLGLMGALVVANPFYILYSAGILAIVALAVSIYFAKRLESF